MGDRAGASSATRYAASRFCRSGSVMPNSRMARLGGQVSHSALTSIIFIAIRMACTPALKQDGMARAFNEKSFGISRAGDQKRRARHARPDHLRRVVTSISDLKARQAAKVREIGEALVTAGYDNLDAQAAVLGLSRSTTWTIIRGTHKSSGLSATVLNRMLSAPDLHPLVRRKVLEYVEEKYAGRYGNTRDCLQRFINDWAAVRQNPQVFRSPACSYEIQWCPRVVRGDGRLRCDLLPCPIRDRTDRRAGPAPGRCSPSHNRGSRTHHCRRA